MIIIVLGFSIDSEEIVGVGPLKDTLDDPSTYGYHEFYFDLLLIRYAFRMSGGKISVNSSAGVVKGGRELVDQARSELLASLAERMKRGSD